MSCGQACVGFVRLVKWLGYGRGYLWDYFNKGSPRTLPTETKIALAKKLKWAPKELGVSTGFDIVAASGFADDAEPYLADSGSLPPHIARFTVRARTLDRHAGNIVPGRIGEFNLNMVEPAEIPPGSVVIVQLYDRRELTRCHGTVLRQFLPPDKLVTNSKGDNDIMALDDPQRPYIAVIKGILRYMLDPINDGDSYAPMS